MTTQIEHRTRLFNVDEYYAMGMVGILPEGGYELLSGVVCPKSSSGPRRFDFDEYHVMIDAGILAADERIELLNGVIVEKSAAGPAYERTVAILLRMLFATLGDGPRIESNIPLRVDSYSELVPDALVLKARDDEHISAHPSPGDVLLLIEISDTPIDSDQGERLSLYARFGAPETWIVNIAERVVETHTDPSYGVYRTHQIFGPDESVSLSAFPDVSVLVSQIIPG